MKLRNVLGFLLGSITALSPSISAPSAPQAGAQSPAIAWTAYQDEAVRLLQEYLRIDTSNPPGNDLAAAQFFHRLFDQAGIPNTVYTYAPGRGTALGLKPLAGYCGIVQCDGYAVYKQMADPKREGGGATLAFCWSHLRRRTVKRCAQ